GDESAMVSSAAAVAEAIRAASSSPVDFVCKIEKTNGGRGGGKNKSLVLPSQEFQRLCIEQIDLFRRIVEPRAFLSVYVRPSDSYVMDRLELRRINFYQSVPGADIVVLVGNFCVPAGLRVSEAEISRKQVEFFPELGAVVFPMVTHPFVVGFLVVELPRTDLKSKWDEHTENPLSGKSFSLPRSTDSATLDSQSVEDPSLGMIPFSSEQQLNAISITRSLAAAYVMDQKAMLLQQSTWQNNVRMSNLVEQIRGSLTSIRSLSKMLSIQLKRSEISYDIIEDILSQGDHIKASLQQLQDAVYLTKVSIMHYSHEMPKMMQPPSEGKPDFNCQLPSRSSAENSTAKFLRSSGQLSTSSAIKDLEFPMPPLALAPSHQDGIRRPCKISDVLRDLVEAITPLAHMQRRVVELCDTSQSLEVAVEEPALRQAFSNLIDGAVLRTDVGGEVQIVSTGAPAGGALVIIDDDGPDMLYMTQMHSLAPFGADLVGEGKLEDNMTWNFIAGLSVAREILESYGCVVRVVSPRKSDAPVGRGGTRLELWLPS
ncbi:chloroplast sensor kinase, partial [Genlisea aurea]